MTDDVYIRPEDIVLHTHRGTEHRVLSVDGDLLQLTGIFPRTPLGMVEFLDRPLRWYVFDYADHPDEENLT